MPAATVAPLSRMAKLASWGISAFFSITSGWTGLIFTIAASPFLMKSGFSSLAWPVAGSSFFSIASSFSSLASCDSSPYTVVLLRSP